MLKWFFFLFSLGLLSACNQVQGGPDPETTTRRFFEALARADFDQAKIYAHAEARRNYLNLLETALAFNQISPLYLRDSLGFNLDSLQCFKQNDKTFCRVCCNKKEGSMQVELVENQGLWLVTIEKEYKIFR